MAKKYLNPEDKHLKPPANAAPETAFAKAFRKGASYYLRQNTQTNALELVIDLNALNKLESLLACKSQLVEKFPRMDAALNLKSQELICHNPIDAYAWLYTHYKGYDWTDQADIYQWEIEDAVGAALIKEEQKLPNATQDTPQSVVNAPSISRREKKHIYGTTPRSLQPSTRTERMTEGGIPSHEVLSTLARSASSHLSLEKTYALILSLRDQIIKYVPSQSAAIAEPTQEDFDALLDVRRAEMLNARVAEERASEKVSKARTWARKKLQHDLRNQLVNPSVPEPSEEDVVSRFQTLRQQELDRRKRNRTQEEDASISTSEQAIPHLSIEPEPTLTAEEAAHLREQVKTALIHQNRANYVRQHIQKNLAPSKHELEKRFNLLCTKEMLSIGSVVGSKVEPSLPQEKMDQLTEKALRELKRERVDALIKEHNIEIPDPTEDAITKLFNARQEEILKHRRKEMRPRTEAPTTKETTDFRKLGNKSSNLSLNQNEKDDLSPLQAQKLMDRARQELRNEIRKNHIQPIPEPDAHELQARFEKLRDAALIKRNNKPLKKSEINSLMKQAQSELREEYIHRITQPSEDAVDTLTEKRLGELEQKRRETGLTEEDSLQLTTNVRGELRKSYEAKLAAKEEEEKARNASEDKEFSKTMGARLANRTPEDRANEIDRMIAEMLEQAAIPQRISLNTTPRGVTIFSPKPTNKTHSEWEKYNAALEEIMAPLVKASSEPAQYSAICHKDRIMMKLDKHSGAYEALASLAAQSKTNGIV